MVSQRAHNVDSTLIQRLACLGGGAGVERVFLGFRVKTTEQ